MTGKLSPIEQIQINIQKEAYNELFKSSKSVIEALNKHFEYVPTVVGNKGKYFRAKIRLKRDRDIHFSSPTDWSFRVKVKKHYSILGIRVFSLHRPRARNYMYEWLFHKALARENVLKLQYRFVELILNGKNLGIYALKEYFDRNLLKRQGRKNGRFLNLMRNILLVAMNLLEPFECPISRSQRYLKLFHW